MFLRTEIPEITNFNCNYLGNLKFLKYREKIVRNVIHSFPMQKQLNLKLYKLCKSESNRDSLFYSL